MDRGQETVLLQVEGMTCTGCEQRVANALRRLEGVREAAADHVTGRVQVALSGEGVEPAVLVERITRVGYEVTATKTGTAAGTGAQAGPEDGPR